MTILKTVYKYFFGKDSSLVWRQFAKENKGAYLPDSEHNVEYTYKSYAVAFSSYTYYTVVGGNSYEKDYTRGIVEFFSPDNLKLTLTPQGIIDNIGKLFGSQDIIIGESQFDKKFMIKGNDEYKIQELFSDKSIQELLLELNVIRLEITNEGGLFDEKVKVNHSMIYFVSEEKIKHIDQLNKLSKLFAELITALTKLNSIKTPKVSC